MSINFRPAGDDSDDEYEDDGYMFGDDPVPSPVKTTSLVNGYMATTAEKQQQGAKPRSVPSLPPRRQDNVPVLHTSTTTGMKLPVDDFRNAVMWGKTDTIQGFLDQGISVDMVLRAGWTALMYACNRGNIAAVEILLANGADPNYQAENSQYSVLMSACSGKGCDDRSLQACVERLVQSGARVDACDRSHTAALTYAAREGRALLVTSLIDAGAELSLQDSRGYTALMWAASRGHVKVAQTLLEARADPQTMSVQGATACDLAGAEGHDTLHILLKAVTAKEDGAMLEVEKAAAEEETIPPADVLTAPEPSIVYGELELFLAGLQLSHLIDVFKAQGLSFARFLQLTDADLLQMGVEKLGERKTVLDAIRETHKAEWQPSSLHSVQYNKTITLSEAVAMVANLTKHAGYMAATLGYMADQMRAHPDILRQAQEGSSAEDLLARGEETLANIRHLYGETGALVRHVGRQMGREDLSPPDLIRWPRKTGWRRGRLGAFLLLGAALVGGALWLRGRGRPA